MNKLTLSRISKLTTFTNDSQYVRKFAGEQDWYMGKCIIIYTGSNNWKKYPKNIAAKKLIIRINFDVPSITIFEF